MVVIVYALVRRGVIHVLHAFKKTTQTMSPRDVAVAREVERLSLTHADLASRSGLPRSAVTGILSGSLQRVTIDRVLRLVTAAGLEADIRVRRAA